MAVGLALTAGPLSAAVWTSFSVMRPLGPVPATVDRSTPNSLASLRAAGEAGALPVALGTAFCSGAVPDADTAAAGVA